jgi:hypothetical protein
VLTNRLANTIKHLVRTVKQISTLSVIHDHPERARSLLEDLQIRLDDLMRDLLQQKFSVALLRLTHQLSKVSARQS